jgi:hypothetical protein
MPVTDWVIAHWELVLIVVVYGIVNLAARPHPDKQTGLMRVLWLILDRFSVMTAERVPGRFKMILAASPREDEQTPAKKP